jgi:hypothetical protein
MHRRRQPQRGLFGTTHRPEQTFGALSLSPVSGRSPPKLGVYQMSTHNVQFMVDQRFDMFYKPECVRQHDVSLKRYFILPLGMNEEKSGLSSRSKDLMTQTTWLCTRI